MCIRTYSVFHSPVVAVFLEPSVQSGSSLPPVLSSSFPTAFPFPTGHHSDSLAREPAPPAWYMLSSVSLCSTYTYNIPLTDY